MTGTAEGAEIDGASEETNLSVLLMPKSFCIVELSDDEEKVYITSEKKHMI